MQHLTGRWQAHSSYPTKQSNPAKHSASLKGAFDPTTSASTKTLTVYPLRSRGRAVMALCKSPVDHGAEHGVPFGGEEEKREQAARPASVPLSYF